MTTPNDNPQTDVSQRALAIARTIDRLEAGSYMIELEKVADRAANWDVKVSGVIRVKEFKAFEPKEKPASIDTKP